MLAEVQGPPQHRAVLVAGELELAQREAGLHLGAGEAGDDIDADADRARDVVPQAWIVQIRDGDLEIVEGRIVQALTEGLARTERLQDEIAFGPPVQLGRVAQQPVGHAADMIPAAVDPDHVSEIVDRGPHLIGGGSVEIAGEPSVDPLDADLLRRRPIEADPPLGRVEDGDLPVLVHAVGYARAQLALDHLDLEQEPSAETDDRDAVLADRGPELPAGQPLDLADIVDGGEIALAVDPVGRVRQAVGEAVPPEAVDLGAVDRVDGVGDHGEIADLRHVPGPGRVRAQVAVEPAGGQVETLDLVGVVGGEQQVAGLYRAPAADPGGVVAGGAADVGQRVAEPADQVDPAVEGHERHRIAEGTAGGPQALHRQPDQLAGDDGRQALRQPLVLGRHGIADVDQAVVTKRRDVRLPRPHS